MRPGKIYYSQNNMGNSFRHGHSIENTFEDLLNGDISVYDIEPITVQKHNRDDELKNKYFVQDGHRRLYIFKVIRVHYAWIFFTKLQYWCSEPLSLT